MLAMGLVALAIFYSCSSTTNTKETKQTQEISVQEAYTNDPLKNLKSGNERFLNGKSAHLHQDSVRLKELIKGQNPQVVIVSCSDSRATPEIVFDQGLGDIFTIRTAGNVMSDYEEGSIEYAVEHAGSKLIVVMGHTHCGAIHAMKEMADDEEAPGHIESIVKSIKEEIEQKDIKGLSKDSIEYYSTIANIEHGVKQLRESKPILNEKFEDGDIAIVGAIYDIETGKVSFLDID